MHTESYRLHVLGSVCPSLTLRRRAGEINGDGPAFIALAISCNGISWSPLIVLSRSVGELGRTHDQPVDGFLLRGGRVFVHLHRDVPGISSEAGSRSRLERYSLNVEALANVTRAAHGALVGCISS